MANWFGLVMRRQQNTLHGELVWSGEETSIEHAALPSLWVYDLWYYSMRDFGIHAGARSEITDREKKKKKRGKKKGETLLKGNKSRGCQPRVASREATPF